MVASVNTWNNVSNTAHPMRFTSFPKLKTLTASEMSQTCLLVLMDVFNGKQPPYGSVIWFTLYNHTNDAAFCASANTNSTVSM